MKDASYKIFKNSTFSNVRFFDEKLQYLNPEIKLLVNLVKLYHCVTYLMISYSMFFRVQNGITREQIRVTFSEGPHNAM